MKLKLKCDNLVVSVTREFNLRNGPAYEFKATEYEKTMDVEQLIIGMFDIAKLIITRGLEVQELVVPKTDSDAEYKDFLAGLQRKHGVKVDDFDKPLTPSDITNANGEFPDVPQ